MLDSINVFKIDISTIAAKSKLSQARDSVDFDGVSDAMRKLGKVALSVAMERIAGDRKSNGSGR